MLVIEIYQGGDKQWRVRIIAKNGRILFMSSESYTRKHWARNAVDTLISGIVSGVRDGYRVEVIE
jgi:uncharacterized protein YegP (UPF0339 family)